MTEDIERVLLTQEEIQAKVAEVGKRITEDFRDKDPVFIGVLKGCFVFMADLMRNVDIRCSMDFMAVSSYRGTSDPRRGHSGFRGHAELSEELPSGSAAGINPRGNAAGQARTAQGGHLCGLFLLRGTGRVCRRLRTGL